MPYWAKSANTAKAIDQYLFAQELSKTLPLTDSIQHGNLRNKI